MGEEEIVRRGVTHVSVSSLPSVEYIAIASFLKWWVCETLDNM